MCQAIVVGGERYAESVTEMAFADLDREHSHLYLLPINPQPETSNV